jgi:hypothetical protein
MGRCNAWHDGRPNGYGREEAEVLDARWLVSTRLPALIEINLMARYQLHLVHRSGKVYLHKAKRNQNMSFSKGKTWNLEDLRAVEVLDVCQSDYFLSF